MSIGGFVNNAGGKGKTKTTSPAAGSAMRMAEQFAGETTDVRTGLLDAMQEVLSTGGSNIPIISRSVERSLQEGSRATAKTEEEIAQSGFAGTPFGEKILAESRMSSEIAAGNTAQSLAQMIFNMIPNFILGQGQTALSGLVSAIPGLSTTRETGTAMGTGVQGGFGGKSSFGGTA